MELQRWPTILFIYAGRICKLWSGMIWSGGDNPFVLTVERQGMSRYFAPNPKLYVVIAIAWNMR